MIDHHCCDAIFVCYFCVDCFDHAVSESRRGYLKLSLVLQLMLMLLLLLLLLLRILVVAPSW
jgi:hypothetical protein